MLVIDGRRVRSTFSAVRDGHRVTMVRYADGTTEPAPTGQVQVQVQRWYVPAGPVAPKQFGNAQKPRASRTPRVGGPRVDRWITHTDQFDR
jgi:hypothetical protein